MGGGYCSSYNNTHTQHNTPQHNTTQHNTTQHNTTQHNTTQHNRTQHNTTQHNTTQHSTAQHSTAQHNTTQHNTETIGYIPIIRFASLTERAIPAKPPASLTTSKNLRCRGVAFALSLTSIAQNTATFLPTSSDLISIVFQPIRSELPLHNPKKIGRPFASLRAPVLFRNSLAAPLDKDMRILF